MRHSYLFLTFFSFFSSFSPILQAQTLQGNIRGSVRSQAEFQPLPGVQVQVLNASETTVVLTQDDGSFVVSALPVGRYDLRFILEGYSPVLRRGLLVTTAKEVVMQVSLRERLYEAEEVVLLPMKEKGAPRNEMATVSALSFDVEETRKFAGGMDDPARLVANLPGVMANPFISDNMISIRGNSPRGMIYRLEGIDIPNPNHFARIGSSGGSFTVFSLQTLDRSDFFVGAFPAEYGNATSGVFDINLRIGNQRRREFAFQVGVLGFDFAAEGPLRKGGNASYLVNYRFSTFNLAKWLVNYPSVPTYQDLSFKLHLPTEKAGTFTLFGLGGLSDRPKPAVLDSSAWEGDLDRFENRLASNMGILGLKHALILGRSTLLQSTVAGSAHFLKDNKEYLEDDLRFRSRERNEYQRVGWAINSSLRHSFSPRHTLKTGLIVTRDHHDYFSQKYDYRREENFIRANEAAPSLMLQAYAQTKFRFSERFTATIGLHALYYDLNGQSSVEPRMGLQYQLASRHVLAFGYGLHSRVEHFATYFTRTQMGDSTMLPNRNLSFLKTHHLVLGYRTAFSNNIKFRAEVYWQRMFDVPVEGGRTYSVINIDELNQLRVLENRGTARNYGLDLGLERFTYRGLYYLINASFFDARYVDAQGVLQQSAFNHNFKLNFLTGKELKVGKRKGYNKLLGLNLNLTLMGGQRYTPLDLEASRLARETILLEALPYSEQDPSLFLADFTLTLRNNKRKHSDVFALQIKNLFQSAIPEYREYDATLDQEITLKASSIFPVLSYKIEF